MITTPGTNGINKCDTRPDNARLSSITDAPHTTNINFAASDGCTVNPPNAIQFRFPCTANPNGLNTTNNAPTPTTNIGHAARFHHRFDTRDATHDNGTATTANIACLSKNVYDEPVAINESTLELDNTITNPSVANATVDPKIK